MSGGSCGIYGILAVPEDGAPQLSLQSSLASRVPEYALGQSLSTYLDNGWFATSALNGAHLSQQLSKIASLLERSPSHALRDIQAQLRIVRQQMERLDVELRRAVEHSSQQPLLACAPRSVPMWTSRPHVKPQHRERTSPKAQRRTPIRRTISAPAAPTVESSPRQRLRNLLRRDSWRGKQI